MRARRDGFRPRYRRTQDRGRGRQPLACARARVRSDHALPAPAQPHRAGCRARPLARAHRAHRRQGAGARARGQRLRAVPGGDGVTMQAEGAVKTAAEQQLAANWQEAKSHLPGPVLLRATAFERFAATGLPHRRVEEWKYTDLRALMRDAKPLAAAPDAAAKARAREAGAALVSIEARRIVLVDGAFMPDLSDLDGLEAGLTIGSLAQALAAGDDAVTAQLGKTVPSEDVALALNTAFMGDGVVIRIAPGVALARPIALVFFNSGARPAAVFTRSLALIGNGARAMLVESHEGANGADDQVNTALELKVGDDAHVDHIKITGK